MAVSDKKIKKQGNDAEKKVSHLLHKLGSEYRVFDNVLVKTGGGTTQIDHVVVSPYGIFVIETKSHKGMIYGDRVGKMWTQCLYGKNGGKFTFYSPYLQNFGHLRNLYKLFNLDCSYFLGLIVFTNESVDISHVDCPNALKAEYLVEMVRSYNRVLFSEAGVAAIIKKLQDANIQSTYQDRKHVKYVKEIGKNNGVLKKKSTKKSSSAPRKGVKRK